MRRNLRSQTAEAAANKLSGYWSAALIQRRIQGTDVTFPDRGAWLKSLAHPYSPADIRPEWWSEFATDCYRDSVAHI